MLNAVSWVQDANWRELVKFCAARGAYRGAGSESLSQLMRGQYSQDMPIPGETGDRHTLSHGLACIHWHILTDRDTCQEMVCVCACTHICSTPWEHASTQQQFRAVGQGGLQPGPVCFPCLAKSETTCRDGPAPACTLQPTRCSVSTIWVQDQHKCSYVAYSLTEACMQHMYRHAHRRAAVC